MTTNSSVMLDSNEEILEQNALLPDTDADTDTITVNSREFVEKSDDILSSTNQLIINLSEKDCTTHEPFKSHDVKSVFHVSNRAGEHVFTIGQCPVVKNIKSFVISNTTGHGLMTFTTKGFLNRICDIEGAGLLSFTQIQHFYGGYTLRDPYKDLVKIRSGWIPFCTCCLEQISSATMTITDLDGTNSGSIFFEKSHSEFDGSTLSINFIPNLNPKAKYMLLAASIQLICVYFSQSGQKRQSRGLIFLYGIFALILLIVCAMLLMCS